MVHDKRPNLHNAYEWGKDVYVKIKQDDKLSHQAMKVKWIEHSSQSNGHYVIGQLLTRYQLKEKKLDI